MPAFGLLAVLLVRCHRLGLLLTPAMYVFGFDLLLPVGGGELIKLLNNQPTSLGEMTFYFGISLMFLVVASIYLGNLHYDQQRLQTA